MKTNRYGSVKALPRFGSRAALIATLLLAQWSVQAAELTVVCPSGGPGAYPSLTAALAAVTSNAGPNTITVSGTCVENVIIQNQSGLLVQAAPGTAPVITNAANPAQITVWLQGSHLVTFNGLDIQGGNPGLFVNQGSDLQMFNTVIEKNVGGGAEALINSDMNMSSCIIRNNGGFGVLVGDSSTAVVMTPIQILNNNGPGAAVYSSGYLKFQSGGGHTIEGNAGAGIDLGPNGHLLLQGGSVATVIRNNVDGLDLKEGSTAEVDAPSVIENNGAVGIRVASSTAVFYGTANGSTISGHSLAGAVVSHSGELTLNGPHVVSNNGNPSGVGIFLERSSLTLQNGAAVSGNAGIGIQGDANSGIVVGPSAFIMNNAATGAQLLHRSLIQLVAPVTIQGNAGANISCDGTALAFGSLAGINRVECPSAGEK